MRRIVSILVRFLAFCLALLWFLVALVTPALIAFRGTRSTNVNESWWNGWIVGAVLVFGVWVIYSWAQSRREAMVGRALQEAERRTFEEERKQYLSARARYEAERSRYEEERARYEEEREERGNLV